MLGRGFVPQVPATNNGSAIQAKATLPMTWNGTMMDAADTETYHLHLSAFLCEKCKGPVITSLLGTRHDQISKETDIPEYRSRLHRLRASCRNSWLSRPRSTGFVLWSGNGPSRTKCSRQIPTPPRSRQTNRRISSIDIARNLLGPYK